MSLRTTALRTGGLVCTVLVAFSLAGCPDNPDTPDAPMGTDAGDAGRDTGMVGDAGACTGLTLCDTAGVTCEGNSLVTCAANAAGCLVETTVNCALEDQVCDASGGTPACVDACADIPEADRCDTVDARVCTGETLEVCTMNAEGCLVLERTACDDMAGGVCAMGTAMLECILPVDPCEGIADACTTAGTSCDGGNLVTCAPNAFGCLVQTTTDCTSATAGACDDSGAAATCTTTDTCPTACTEGTSCDGPELVTCAADAFGCLVETRTDCTDATFGFCDADAAPAAMCSTAAVDPCMGVTECGTEPARTCTGDTLTVCAANAFGCFIAEDTDCTVEGNICNSDEPAMCVPPSVCGDGMIEGSETCDDSNAVAGDGCSDACVIEAGFTCMDSPSVCYFDEIEPNEDGTPSTGGSGTTANDFDAAARTNADTNFATIPVLASASYRQIRAAFAEAGDEDVFAVENDLTGPVSLRLDTWKLGTGFGIGVACGSFSDTVGETVLRVYDATGTSIAVNDDRVSGSDVCSGLTVTLAPGQRVYVHIMDFGDNTALTTGYALEARFTPVVCGDGVRNGAEACDDGDTDDGDGCSAMCVVEAGFICDTASPSACVGPATNGTCATATAVTANATFPVLNYASGGPRPTGAGCGTGTGDTTLYFSVTIPPNSAVTALTSGSLNRVLMTQNACSDAGCASVTGTSPETVTLLNATATAETRIVAVRPSSSTGTGTLGISFTYAAIVCGDGTRVAGAEACDDGDTDSGDGCSATCTVEANFTCNTASPTVCTPVPYIVAPITLACADMSGASTVVFPDDEDDDGVSARAALPFALTHFGAAMSHYSISTNGFVGLFASDTGSITASFSNSSTVPSTSSPNGYIAPFWDDLAGMTVRTLTTGTAGSQVFVIEWDGVTFTGSAPVRVQGHIRESGVIEYHYCAGSGTNSNGNSATIATENAAGTAGVAFSINTANVTPGTTAVRFTPNP